MSFLFGNNKKEMERISNLEEGEVSPDPDQVGNSQPNGSETNQETSLEEENFHQSYIR